MPADGPSEAGRVGVQGWHNMLMMVQMSKQMSCCLLNKLQAIRDTLPGALQGAITAIEPHDGINEASAYTHSTAGKAPSSRTCGMGLRVMLSLWGAQRGSEQPASSPSQHPILGSKTSADQGEGPLAGCIDKGHAPAPGAA